MTGDQKAKLSELKAKLKRGSAQADCGELVDPKDVLARIAALKRRRAAAKK